MLQNTKWGDKKKEQSRESETQGTQDEEKTKQKHNTICIWHHHTQTRHTSPHNNWSQRRTKHRFYEGRLSSKTDM